MPDRRAVVEAPRPEQPVRLRDDRLGLISMALLFTAFVAATLRVWITPTWYLDDYWACGLVFTDGLTGLLGTYWDSLGLYRLITVPYYLVMGPLCDMPVLQKAFGLALHLNGGLLLFRILRLRLGWSRIAVVGACTVLLFNPLSLEAVSWVAAAKHFPLSLVAVLMMTDRLLSDPPKVGAAAFYAGLAVISNEQTILLVLMIPLLVMKKPWAGRLKASGLVGGPGVLYLAFIRLTGGFGDSPRLSGDTAASPLHLFHNFSWAGQNLIPFIPGGSRWGEFSDGSWTRLGIAALVVVTVALMALVWPGIRDSRTVSASTGLLGVPLGATLMGAAALPILLAANPWASPRVWYLPHAAIALGIGGLLHWMSQVGPRQLMHTLCALLMVGWALMVVDGLAREANAYVTTFNREQIVAQTVSTEMEANDELVLLRPPWSLVSPEEAPFFGNHIAQAFATRYSAIGALRVLTGADPLEVTIAHESSAFCVREDGDVLIRGKAAAGGYVVFDFATMTTLPGTSDGTALFKCD